MDNLGWTKNRVLKRGRDFNMIQCVNTKERHCTESAFPPLVISLLPVHLLMVGTTAEKERCGESEGFSHCGTYEISVSGSVNILDLSCDPPSIY